MGVSNPPLLDASMVQTASTLAACLPGVDTLDGGWIQCTSRLITRAVRTVSLLQGLSASHIAKLLTCSVAPRNFALVLLCMPGNLR
jgi:hypothetical protein